MLVSRGPNLPSGSRRHAYIPIAIGIATVSARPVAASAADSGGVAHGRQHGRPGRDRDSCERYQCEFSA